VASFIGDVRAAYEKLGLDPFERFARQAVEKNKTDPRYADARRKNIYRGIGATTWMCVYGVVRSLADHKVYFVFQADPPSDLLNRLLSMETGQVCSTYTRGINFSVREKGAHYADQRTISWTITKDPESIKGRVGIPAPGILRDTDFKARLARRLQGPFAMARYVIERDGKLLVYAEDDEFLFETTEEGAKALAVEIQRSYP